MTYYQEFEGVVLSKRKHREKDALVKIFTKEYGKMMFFVKNSHTLNHSLRLATIPLTRATFLGRINEQGLNFLHDSKAVTHYRMLQEDMERHAYAMYLMQLSDAAIEDRIQATSLYDWLVDSLEVLQYQSSPSLVVHLFELKLLTYFGTYLTWDRCTICHSTIQPFDFSLKYQGMLCKKHWHQDVHRLRVVPRACHIASMLKKIQSPNQLGTVNIQIKTQMELKRLMDEIYYEYVGIHLKSKKFIDQMYNWQTAMIEQTNEQL